MRALARRWLKATALLVAVGVSLAGTYTLTVAKVRMDEVLPKLKGQTSLPIRVPREIPGVSKVYADVARSLNPEQYTIFFHTKKLCYSWTPCTHALVMVDRGSSSTRKDYIPVQLAGGLQGAYKPPFPGYDAAELSWQQDGVQYRIFIKSRQPQLAVQLANATILGEIKK